jgi:sodium transport system permease protein
MSMSRLARVVFRKELRDHMRDRRTLTSLVLSVVLNLVVISVTFTVVASWVNKEKPLELPVVGRQHAPTLMEWLEQAGVKLSEAPEGYEEKVRAGTLSAVLVVPEDYGQEFSAGRPAKVQLVVDNSRQEARASVHRVELLLQGYGGLVGMQRLMARGVAPELVRPLQVQQVDLATPERMAATLLNILPWMLLLSAFAGGMSVAIDIMAGERERNSLEPLLLSPVPLGALVVGKWMATVVVSAATVLLTLVGLSLVLPRLPLEDLGVTLRMDGPALLRLGVALLPLALLAPSMQMLVSTFARSYKEGQTYQSYLLMLPMLLGIGLMFASPQSKLWMFAVPMMSQDRLIGEVLRGEPLGVLPFLLSAVGSAALTAVCLALNTRLLRDERVVFGRSS